MIKTLVAALLLGLASTSVLAQEPPSMFESMKSCTFYAAKVTEYSVLAENSKDVDAYKALIQTEIDGIESVKAKQLLAYLAGVAWGNRTLPPTQVGMAVYEECFNRMGTKT